MAALCLNASLETLRPLCCCHTLCLIGDLCCCLYKGSPQAVQAVVMLSACHVLQNSPQFIVQAFEVCIPWKPILSVVKARRFLRSHSWVVLAFWAGTESWWKTHSWPMKRVTLSCFTTPCSTSSWYTWTPFSLLSCKNEDVLCPDGTPPTKLWCRKGDGLPASWERTSRDTWA